MATDPAFGATPLLGAVTVPATADASLTAPTNVATVATAGASGSKVEQVSCMQIASTTVVSVVNVFLYDGTAYHLWDFFAMPINTLTTTTENPRVDIAYSRLTLPTGWSVRATVTVAGGVSAFKLFALGESL